MGSVKSPTQVRHCYGEPVGIIEIVSDERLPDIGLAQADQFATLSKWLHDNEGKRILAVNVEYDIDFPALAYLIVTFSNNGEEIEPIEKTVYGKSEPDVYKKALDLLREKGWIKGTRHQTVTGEFCLVGAIECVTQGSCCDEIKEYDPYAIPEVKNLMPLIEDRIGRLQSVDSFNDSGDTFFSDVEELLITASKTLGKRGTKW